MRLPVHLLLVLALALNTFSQESLEDIGDDFFDEAAKGFGRNAQIITPRKDDLKYIK